MGQIIRAKCTECEYSAELFIGGGMSDCNFEAVAAQFPDEQKSELAQIRAMGADGLSVCRYPCTCNSCGTIFVCTAVHYKLDGTDNTEQIIYTHCPKCSSGDVRRFSINAAEEHCPECGSPVTFVKEGLWD